MDQKHQAKNEYFIDTQLKKSRSPDLNRFKKKLETQIKRNKKKQLMKKDEHRSKTLTENQIYKIQKRSEKINQQTRRMVKTPRNLDIHLQNINESTDPHEFTQNIKYQKEMKGPHVSRHNSRNSSPKQQKVKKSKCKQSKQTSKEYKLLENPSKSSPKRQFENTGFTSGSNYASINSKNQKNGIKLLF